MSSHSPIDEDGNIIDPSDLHRHSDNYNFPTLLCFHGEPIRIFIPSKGEFREKWVGACNLKKSLDIVNTGVHLNLFFLSKPI